MVSAHVKKKPRAKKTFCEKFAPSVSWAEKAMAPRSVAPPRSHPKVRRIACFTELNSKLFCCIADKRDEVVANILAFQPIENVRFEEVKAIAHVVALPLKAQSVHGP